MIRFELWTVVSTCRAQCMKMSTLVVVVSQLRFLPILLPQGTELQVLAYNCGHHI